MAEKESVTCRVRFEELLQRFTDGTSGQILQAGIFFMAGQAEKVFNRVCPAAMSRPFEGYYDAMAVSIEKIAAHYGLVMVTLPYINEIWICGSDYQEAIYAMSELEMNSSAWHFARARLCGIPSEDVDIEFHLRKGYGNT